MDFTVSTPVIVSTLYERLPANGNELVLFDVNRTVKFGPLLRPSADTALAGILPDPPRRYRTTGSFMGKGTATWESEYRPGGYSRPSAVTCSVVSPASTARATVSRLLEKIKTENEDQKHGVDIVKKALSWPARQIAINAGEDGSVVSSALAISLYGLTPDGTENYGIELGALAPRGERNVLIASLGRAAPRVVKSVFRLDGQPNRARHR